MINNQLPGKIRLLGALPHAIGAFFLLLSPLTLPLTWLLWLIIREIDPFIDRCGKSALNFQASVILYLVVIFGLLGIMCGVLPQGNIQSNIVNFIGYPLFFLSLALLFCSCCLSIFAAILAIRGKVYSYPLTIRFLSEAL
jgi:uncharacterized protein